MLLIKIYKKLNKAWAWRLKTKAEVRYMIITIIIKTFGP